MNYNVAAVGAEEITFPFRQAGIDCFLPCKGEALYRQIAQLMKDGYGVLFISEDALKTAPRLLETYDNHPNIALIPVPGLDASGSAGVRRMEELTEKALGQKIL